MLRKRATPISRRELLFAAAGGAAGIVSSRQLTGKGGEEAAGPPVAAPYARMFLVAAANASQEDRDAADFVCRGKDDHSVINRAIAACGGSGGLVLLTPGTFRVSGSVLLRQQVALQGAGRATVLVGQGRWRARDGSHFGGVIELATDTTSQTALRQMTIDGDKEHCECKGIIYRVQDYPTNSPGGPDSTHVIDDVHVIDTASVGVHLTGGSHRASVVTRVRVYGAGKQLAVEGLLLECFDGFLSHVDVGASSGDGIRVAGANNRLTGCKSWYSRGSGFHIRGVRNQLAACESQDNAGHGYLIAAGPNTLVACHADSNSRPDAGGQAGVFDGFHLPFTEVVQLVACQAYDRKDDEHISQRYGFYIGSNSRDCQIVGTARHNDLGSIGGPGLRGPGMVVSVTGDGGPGSGTPFEGVTPGAVGLENLSTGVELTLDEKRSVLVLSVRDGSGSVRRAELRLS